MGNRKASLYRRLLLILLPAGLVLWLIAAAGSYFDARHETDELFDAQLTQEARVLLTMSQHELAEELAYLGKSESAHESPLDINIEYGHPYEKKLAFQLWVDNKTLVLRSTHTPDTPLAPMVDGFHDPTIRGEKWRIYSVAGPQGRIRVLVGEQSDIRNELSAKIAARVLAPQVFSLPILAVLIWWGVSRGLAPLSLVTRELKLRDPGHLGALSTDDVPADIKPLVDTLNLLFARLRRAFESERRFTSDAAHELRTPLAALKTQAQVAQRAVDDSSRTRALSQVASGVDRAIHLLQQMLVLARLEPEAFQAETENLDLSILVREVVADMRQKAQDAKVEMRLNAPEETIIRGQALGLKMLVRNLLDNAIGYNSCPGLVELNLTSQFDATILQVADSGAGLPEEDYERVFQRFYRRLGTQVEGSGLGLSIVSCVAELHGASLQLKKSTYNGLCVEVRFPVVSAAMSKAG